MALVLNSGSSSLKCSFFDDGDVPVRSASFFVERIGDEASSIKINFNDREQKHDISIPDHSRALELVIDKAVQLGIDIDKIKSVGHRVVHGGEYFSEPTLVDARVLEKIENCIPLAPLHNPANLQGIFTAKKLFAKAEHVAVFDTAFHQTLAPEHYLYALPYEFYERHKIRKYGFHGTSHKYITKTCAAIYGHKSILSCHLGNGASICAIKNGQSVDTSMGFTPLQGLVMGTRSGDIDPAIIFYLLGCGYTPSQLSDILNNKSGLSGLSQISNDMRDLHNKRAHDTKADISISLFCLRAAQYMGAYFATMADCEAVVFTAGIGENDSAVREQICTLLQVPDLQLDHHKNTEALKVSSALISTLSSQLPVYIIRTDEEYQIAVEMAQLL